MDKWIKKHKRINYLLISRVSIIIVVFLGVFFPCPYSYYEFLRILALITLFAMAEEINIQQKELKKHVRMHLLQIIQKLDSDGIIFESDFGIEDPNSTYPIITKMLSKYGKDYNLSHWIVKVSDLGWKDVLLIAGKFSDEEIIRLTNAHFENRAEE